MTVAYFHGYGGHASSKPDVLRRAFQQAGQCVTVEAPAYRDMDEFFAAIDAFTDAAVASRVDTVCGSSLGAFAALCVAKQVAAIRGYGLRLTQIVNPCVRPFAFLMKHGHVDWAAACVHRDSKIRAGRLMAYLNKDDELLGQHACRWVAEEGAEAVRHYPSGGHRATNFDTIASDIVLDWGTP